jgi:hypothetical protein
VRFILAALLFASLAAAAAPAGLTPALEKWKQQIEERGGGSLVIVRVPTDKERNEISLPEETPFRNVLKNYFLDPGFVSQFSRAHALNLNYEGPEGRIHYVLLNLAVRTDWEDFEAAVLGHEFGHIWLNIAGYPAAILRGRPSDCAGAQATDIVQHVLIRRELVSRGIDYDRYWKRNLDLALAHLRGTAGDSAAPSLCQALAQITLWVDVALGVNAAGWPNRQEFLDLMFVRFSGIETAARSIETLLRGAPVEQRAAYQDALLRTYSVLRVQTVSPAKKPR